MHTGPWKQHIQHHQQWAPSPIFFPDFPLFSIWNSAHFLIWKCALDPENITQHHHQPSLFFFWFFPYFIVIFSFSTALPSIYGNMQLTLKTAPYPIFFFYFFLLFYLFVNAISFMEMCTGPWNDEIAVREWSCYWNEKWNVLWQEWKRMKEISFSCCRDLEWNRCCEWMKIHFIHLQ